MFGILGARDRSDGTEEYASFDELFAALKSRMQKDGYKVVKSRTHRNKVGGTYEKGSEVVRCDLVCDRGGQPYKCTATQLKTSTKKTNCPWKAKAVNRKTLGKWILTIICSEHNHEARTPDPPTDEEDADAEGDADIVQDAPATVAIY
ncbi:far1 DNA-binding domain protein [Colletotrichum tofieldiae]|nr:far1 DNA-binding domain protein [Colletotrichum tofieldiae]GKT72978.1 far1 DNA-binding domain protein [Colletotrichum tofieldiae]